MKNNCICFIMGILCAFSAYSQHDDVKRLMQQYHYREAAQQLQNESETPENLRLKAECFEKLYRYQDAIAMYEKLVQTHPSDINIVIALAEVSAQAGNADAALNYWKKACELSPDNLFLQTKKAMAHYRSEDWANVISSSEKVFKTDSVPILLRMVGDACMQLKNGLGITYYQKAIEKNPSDELSVTKLGRVFYAMHAFDSTIQLTHNYLKNIDRDNKTIGQLNGMANYSAGNYHDAIIQLTHNTRLGDSTYTTCYFLGMSFFASKVYFKASQWLDKAYQQDSADVNLMYYLGRSLVDTYDKKRGIRILQRGINKINEQQAMLYDFDTSIGYGHLRLQQYAKSIEAFKKAYARKKTNTSILYNIAFAYDALKNYDAAIDYYEQFLKTTSDNYVSNKQEYEDTANISSRKEMCRIVKKRIEELKKELFFKGKK